VFLAWRDLRRTWRRFLLVGAVVALVAVLSTVLAGLADGLVRDGTSGVRALPYTNLAMEPGAAAVFSRSTVTADDADAFAAIPDVEASPVGVSFVNAASLDGGASLDLALFGVPAGSFLADRGDAQDALAGPPGLVLSSEFADKGVRLGDRYRLGGSDVELPVVGFTIAGSYGHVPIAFTSLATWQSINYGSDARGRASAIALRVPAGTDTGAVDAAAAATGTEVISKSRSYDGSPGFTAETATMTLIRGFLLVISALIVGAFFTVLAVQRTRQTGLLKAMGASDTYVLRDGIGQMAVVVIASTLVGTVVGGAMVAALARTSAPVDLSPRSIATSAALLVLTGLVGSLVAFRRVTSVEPAVALGVEG
jgi:putative ABC transport system permease protein